MKTQNFGFLGSHFKKVMQLLQGFVLVFVSCRVDEKHLHLCAVLLVWKTLNTQPSGVAGFRTEVRIWYWHGGRKRGGAELSKDGGAQAAKCGGQSSLGRDRRATTSQRWCIGSNFVCVCVCVCVCVQVLPEAGEEKKGKEQKEFIEYLWKWEGILVYHQVPWLKEVSTFAYSAVGFLLLR